MSAWLKILTACPGVWSEKDYSLMRSTRHQKSDPAEFGVFWDNLSDKKKAAFVPTKDNSWAVLGDDETGKYIACIDRNHFAAGNLYNDDTPKEIYIKIALSTLARPFFILGKTTYHLTAGHIRAIVKGIEKDRPPEKIAEKVARQVVDIFRTPAYETVILVVGLSALIACPFKQELAYDFRAVIGKLTHELLWGSRKTAILNPCMRRENNLMDWSKTLTLRQTDVEELIKEKWVKKGQKKEAKIQKDLQIKNVEELCQQVVQICADNENGTIGWIPQKLDNNVIWKKPLLPLNNKESLLVIQGLFLTIFEEQEKELDKPTKAYILDKYSKKIKCLLT